MGRDSAIGIGDNICGILDYKDKFTTKGTFDRELPSPGFLMSIPDNIFPKA